MATSTKADSEAGVRNMRSESQISDLIRAAEAATAREKEMGVWQAVKNYPTAICYSMALSLCLVMEGYDTSLTNNFFSLPQFRQKFGQPLDNGEYQLTAIWMSGLQNGTQVGQILGLLVAGLVAERYGYRKTIIGALAALLAFIFLLFFAANIEMLLAGGSR